MNLKSIFYNLRIRVTQLSRIYEKVCDQINLNQGNSVLDVGCGNGNLLKMLVEKYGNKVNFFGIDPDNGMLSCAREKLGPEVNLKTAFADDIPFSENSFDLVFSTLAMHHVESSKKQKSIEEIIRVTKTGGRILIADFGRPQGFFGNIFFYFSRHHYFAKGNMELIEKTLSSKTKKISHIKQFGYIEHLFVEKL